MAHVCDVNVAKTLVPREAIFLLFCPVEVVCLRVHTTKRYDGSQQTTKKKGLKTRLAFQVFKENHLSRSSVKTVEAVFLRERITENKIRVPP